MNSPLSTEIAALHSQLSRYHQEKESWFQKTKALQQQLKEKILQLRQQQQHSRETSKHIPGLRGFRDAANREVKQLIQHIKILQESRKSLLAKHSSNLEASRILHHIEALELKVETEALTPEQETRMMKKIRELKKQYGSQKELLTIFNQIKQLSKDIAEKRKKANEYHEQFRAAISEKNSPESLEQSKEILELRKQQDATFQKFLEAKQQHTATLKQLKEKSRALQAELSTIKIQKQQALQKKQQQLAALLKEKEKSVEEKLRTKKRLTNEDLLVFQQS